MFPCESTEFISCFIIDQFEIKSYILQFNCYLRLFLGLGALSLDGPKYLGFNYSPLRGYKDHPTNIPPHTLEHTKYPFGSQFNLARNLFEVLKDCSIGSPAFKRLQVIISTFSSVYCENWLD